MRRFFIYSTPRSGSAWLANFLTYGDSFCKHEPSADGEITFADYPVSGAIDTGASFLGYLPPPGTLVFHLWRDPAEVADSLRKIGLPSYDLSAYMRGFEYAKLFDVDYLEKLWNLVTALPFNRERAELLIEMNIQRDVELLMRRVYGRL